MKEQSLPKGYHIRTKAPLYHEELLDLVKRVLEEVKASPQGDVFLDQDLLRIYRFVLEYGQKKNESLDIPWSRLVQAIAFVSSGACIPKPGPDQLRRIKSLLRLASEWKQENLHPTQLTELLPEQKARATAAKEARARKAADDILRLEAERATRWAPNRKKR